jgi:hypothetical protein
MDKRLLLAIQYVANERAIVLPWDTIGEHLDVTSGAISQHLAKLRHRLVDWGFSVPPPLRRGGNNAIQGPKPRATASRRSSTRKDYESDGYENENEEEPDWKEEEYGEEESDVQMTGDRVMKKSGGKIVMEDNGDSEEDVKPRVRAQFRQHAGQKRARIEDESYAPPRGMGEQSHSHRRPRIEAAFVSEGTRASRSSRAISSSERSVSSDVETRDVGNKSKSLKHADVGEMFSEFSRPARVSKTGQPEVTGVSADPAYGRSRQQQTDRLSLNRDGKSPYSTRNNAEPGDIFSRGTGNTLSVDQGNGNPYNGQSNLKKPQDRFHKEVDDSFFGRQDDHNLHNAYDVLQPRNRLPREAGDELFVEHSSSSYNIRDSPEQDDRFLEEAESEHSSNQATLVQQMLGITNPAHTTSPPTTPKDKILRNPYVNTTVTAYGPSSVGSTLNDRGQSITPIAMVTAQNQHNATDITSNSLIQPDHPLPDEPLYSTLYPYPQFETLDSNRSEVKQEPRHSIFKSPGLQSHSDGERRQYDGLHIPSQEPFPALDFNFDAFLDPNGLGDTTDCFYGTF